MMMEISQADGSVDPVTAVAASAKLSRERAVGNPVDDYLEEVSALITSEDADDETLVAGLSTIRYWMRTLKVLESDLVERLAEGRRTGDVIAGLAEVRKGTRRVHWDRDAAQRAILSRAREAAPKVLVNRETGELAPDWDAAIAAVTKHWLLANPRTTAMKEVGLDPGEYSEIERDADGNVKLTSRIELLS